MTTQTPQLPHTIHPLMRPRLNINSPRMTFQQPQNILLHRRLKPRHLWLLQNQRHIHIPNLVPIPRHNTIGMLHEFGGVASLPAGIGILVYLSNVGEGKGTEDGVDDAVVDYVSVRVGYYS